MTLPQSFIGDRPTVAKSVAIIGAGHNGLTCAAYLAKAGFAVDLFEKKDLVGGLCVSEKPFTMAPEIKVSSVASYFGMLRAEVIRELDLENYGLKPYLTDPVEIVLLDNDQFVFTPRDGSEAKTKVAGLDEKEKEGWQKFWAEIQKAAALVYPYYLKPGLTQKSFQALLRENGLEILADYVFDRSLFELLDQYVSNENLKAVAATCTPGFASAPGSVFGCIHHGTASTAGEFGAWGQVFGGMGEITRALSRAAEQNGARIHLQKAVESLVEKDGKITELVFTDGTRSSFDIVVSAVDPFIVFDKMLATSATTHDIRKHLTRHRPKVSAAKLHFLLDELPEFKTLAAIKHNHKGVIVCAPPVQAVSKAAASVPAGEMPERLMLTMAFPTLEDPPAGDKRQVLTVDVHYLPARLGSKDWTEADDQALLEATIKTIETQCADFKKHILESFVVSPRALAERYNLPSLSCWHLPMSSEYVFENRSLPGCDHYHTPLSNLYLCSAGTYPGGNVTGAPGHNVAKLLIDRYSQGVTVFAARPDHAESLSAAIASVYQEALGKDGVQKEGHEPYPDSDLFSSAGVKETLTAGERLIAVAQIEENDRPVLVGAMVADRLSPNHVEFNSMVVPVKRRGHKIGSRLVQGLAEIVEKDLFTVNCTELVTHSLASQAAHFHQGFSAICGFGYCHYPNVFFKDHPESVLWVTKLQGTLTPAMRTFRRALGRHLGRHVADVKQKLIASQASNLVSLPSGRLNEQSLSMVAEVLKERVSYVPPAYKHLVESILFQFEDLLDCTVKNWVRPAPLHDGQQAEVEGGSAVDKGITIEWKEGFGHSYIILAENFICDTDALLDAVKSVKERGKRYIKVCFPANNPQTIAAAECLRQNGFVFHSYLPLYGYKKPAEEGCHDGQLSPPEFFDILSLQWIAPTVVKANPLPGETDSVIKLYGYPLNLSGFILKTIAAELAQIDK